MINYHYDISFKISQLTKLHHRWIAASQALITVKHYPMRQESINQLTWKPFEITAVSLNAAKERGS